MALTFSTAMRNFIAAHGPWLHGLGNAKLEIYTGSKPASADTAPTGTLLNTYTLAGGAYTAETRATAVLVLAGTSGSVDTLKAGGSVPIIGAAVPFGASLAATADALALAINNYKSVPKFTATSNGVDTVTVSAPVGLGAGANGLTVAVTVTTLTCSINGGSSSAFGGTGSAAGVTAVNGINFLSPPSAGVLSRESTVWQGTAVATGTAGWFRVREGADSGDTSTTYRRMDGTVATSGGDLNLGSTTFTSAQVYTITTGDFTVPSA